MCPIYVCVQRSLIALMRNVLAAHSHNGQRDGRRARVRPPTHATKAFSTLVVVMCVCVLQLPYRGSECAVDGRVVRAFVRWRYAARLAEPDADGQLIGPQPFPTLSGLHLCPQLLPAQLPEKRYVRGQTLHNTSALRLSCVMLVCVCLCVCVCVSGWCVSLRVCGHGWRVWAADRCTAGRQRSRVCPRPDPHPTRCCEGRDP